MVLCMKKTFLTCKSNQEVICALTSIYCFVFMDLLQWNYDFFESMGMRVASQ